MPLYQLMNIYENGFSTRSTVMTALTAASIIALFTPYPQSAETFQQDIDILSTEFSTNAQQALATRAYGGTAAT
jgi:hypothetical protein